MWRDGKLLVVGREEPFPDRCVKTNRPAELRRIRQGLYWQPIWALPLQLLALLGLSHVTTPGAKEAIVSVGVCDEVLRARRRRFVVAGLILLAGFTAMICGILTIPQGFAGALAIVGGILVVCFGLFFYMHASLIVSPKRITDEIIWIKGVHPDFLAELPEWPGENALRQ
jgi:hypothetical protein